MHMEEERELVLVSYSPPATWFCKSSFTGTQLCLSVTCCLGQILCYKGRVE